jgi:Anti-sigma-K factor rskA, C-terminal/Putative zinc-finger
VNTPIDLHALTGAYAVDALDELERARFEQHLAGCPDCRAEVDSLREATALIAETTATAPPARLRDRVLADIATVRPLPPEAPRVTPVPTTPVTAPAAAEPHRRFRPSLLAAAAAVVVLLGTGTYVVTEALRDDTSQAPPQAQSEVEAVLQAEDAESYRQVFDDGSEAKLVRSPSLGKAVLVTDGMAPPPEGHVYELWLDHEKVGMVPAGLMAEGGEHAVLLEGDAATAIGAGITIEPEGGSEKPTLSDVVTTFSFQQA